MEDGDSNSENHRNNNKHEGNSPLWYMIEQLGHSLCLRE